MFIQSQISNFPSGIYILTLINNDQYYTQKLVLTHKKKIMKTMITKKTEVLSFGFFI